jgi:hypothetical protein
MLSLSTRLDQISKHQPTIRDLEQDGDRLELESSAAALDAKAHASPTREYVTRAGRGKARNLDATTRKAWTRHGHITCGGATLWQRGVCARVEV